MNYFLDILREIAVLTFRVAPYFLLGAAAGTALQVFVSHRWAGRLWGGTGLRPLLSAIGVAAALPGCSCATIPMAAGLKSTGTIRLGTVAAFVFMSPLLSPITIVLTWSMLGWQMTLARVVASVVGSFGLGLLMNVTERWLAPDRRAVSSATADPCACKPNAITCEDSSTSATFWATLRIILRAITPYFLLGMVIAGILTALVPEVAIPRYLGGAAGVPAYLLAVLVGVPLYVCEAEEVPITFALLGRGLGPGPALTFLLGSVGTCIPTMLMVRRVIGHRATWLYIVYWTVFAIAAGLVFQAISRTIA